MRCKNLSFLAALCLGGLAASGADDLAKEFQTAQRSIQMQLKAKRLDVRVAAIRKLEAYPLVESAKLLVQQGLASPDEELHQAAYATLLKFRNQPEICSYLQETVTAGMQTDGLSPATTGAIGVLLAAEAADLRQAAQAFLERIAGAGGSGVASLVILADDLGAQADDTSLDSLLRLMKLAPFEDSFSLRRAVVQNLMRFRRTEAIRALVALLPTANGEVRADIVQYLTSVSGQRLGMRTGAWGDWWQAQQATFQFPAPSALRLVPRGALSDGGTPSYYGLPLYGTRLVFVIDTSASMNGPRILAAKRELIRAIADLPAGVNFNVLAFNSRVSAWQPQLVPSANESKQAAARYVMAQELGFNTASYDALEAALGLNTESIYFLTDGAPHGGKVTQPAQIVEVLTRANRIHRVTINSIGIGVGAPGNAFDNFLRTLSARNFGEYHRIDN